MRTPISFTFKIQVMQHVKSTVPNDICILKVANGFLVEMPKPVISSNAEFMDGVTKSMEPFIDKILAAREDDDVMREIRQRQREEQRVEEQLQQISTEEVGTDQYVHVFATWDGVMDFLSKLDL